MAKKRTPTGRGEVEQLPSGKFRAVLSRVAVVAGVKKRVRASKTFAKRKDAWDWLDAQGRAGPVATQTVGEWLTQWLDIQAGKVAPSTLAADAWQVGRWVRPGLAPVKLRDLDAAGVDRWLARVAAGGGSPDAVQKAGATLRKCLNAAVRYRVLAANPMTGVVTLSEPRRAEKTVMTAAELRAFLAAADAAGTGHVFRLWADAGLRPGELFALDWKDIDPAAGTVSVRKSLEARTNRLKEAKTPKSRRVLRLSRPTLAAVAAARPADAAGPFLPAATGGRVWATTFNAFTLAPLLKAAGLEDRGFTAYTFRHTMASLLLSAGVSILVVSRRLGHAKVSMTLDVYAHLIEGDADKAADAMGAVFDPPAPR